MSATRLLVLGVVRIFQPVHGYDVQRELTSWQVEAWASVAPGSIYSQLKTLTKARLVEVVDTEQEGSRPARTTYRVTADGEVEFFRLLRTGLWEVSRSTAMLLAALSFFPELRRNELIAALEHRAAQLEAGRAQLPFVVEELERMPETPDHVAEAFLLGRDLADGELRWTRAFADRLRAGEYDVASDSYTDPWGRYHEALPDPQEPAVAPDRAG